MPQTVLRPLKDADKWRLHGWRNQPEVARWMYRDHEIGPDEHEAWFAKAMSDPTRAYWIIEVDGQAAGLANLYDLDTRNGQASWAYYLASPDVRGQGVGAYVEFLVLEQVFIARRLNKLWCEVLADNETVSRLHLSFGFRQEAHLRQHITKAGVFMDVLGFGLLRDEWIARRAASCERLMAKGHPARLGAL